MTQAKHTAADLKQMQSLPLSAKILMTKRRIREWYEYWDGQVYVSFSGGKDSTVLKHLVDSMYDDVPAVFVNTGLEYPEIQQFVREVKNGKYDCFNTDVEMIRPEMRFDEVIQKYGYPVIGKRVAHYIEYYKKGSKWAINMMNGLHGKTGEPNGFSQNRYGKWKYIAEADFKVSDKCCDVMKKKPLHIYKKKTQRKPFLGSMATESKQREEGWLKTGCNAFDSKDPISKPLSFWTEQDILHYIKQFDVPYCSVYGDIILQTVGDQMEGQMNLIDYIGKYEPEDTLETTGCNRTGCMFCMFGCHLEKEPNRFQRMKQTHPKQYAYCMDQLGLKEVLEYIGVPYE